MVARFGSREICDVTFKAITEGQKVGTKNFHKGQPVFIIDTATASSMEQATTTVYAQGGRGYNRLIAWEGEKTVTFNITDALMSGMGLAMLTGAGITEASKKEAQHIHISYDVTVDATGAGVISIADLKEELGTSEDVHICTDAVAKPYAMTIDSTGAVIGWVDDVTLTENENTGIVDVQATGIKKAATLKVDFYVYMNSGLTTITIAPDSFGGYFYVEADTLYRLEATGQDVAATLTFPKVKIQSGFTMSMAPTGDPSTFDFVMDAFPARTIFSTKKVVCDIAVVDGADNTEKTESHEEPAHPFLNVSVDKLSKVAADENQRVSQANQDMVEVSVIDGQYTIKVDGDLNAFTFKAPGQGTHQWVGLAINTGEADITKVKYNNKLLTADDVDEAKSVDVPAGSFVLWVKADEADAKTGLVKAFTLETKDKAITPVDVYLKKVSVG